MLHPYHPYASLDVYRQYYTEQGGSPTKVFKGRRVEPFLKTVGIQLLKTGIGLGSDVIGEKSFKDAALS